MYKIRSFALVALAILSSGIFLSAGAQIRRLPPIYEPPAAVLSGSYSAEVTANELSTGELDFNSGETYGWTCYGTTKGDLSGFMFISLNYSRPASPPEGEIGTISGPSQITGGSWSKLIFIDGQYAGSVYGKIVGGQMVLNTQDRSTSISLQLTADDGTGSFVGTTGTGTFEGLLNPEMKSSTVSGTLTLNY